ncbi:hypothetical protein TNCV_4927821 [Trichonephila clavipes]|nr:hypothetical protein TNCV_4927821 [Trichonephila clavipes]
MPVVVSGLRSSRGFVWQLGDVVLALVLSSSLKHGSKSRGPLRFGVLAVTLLQGECRVVRASNPQHSVH